MYREDIIYIQYKSGMSIEEIATHHSLKESTVRYIVIKETDGDFDSIEKFKRELRLYLADKSYPIANITRITHSLSRFISMYRITSVEELIKVLKNDIYIRGIGIKSKEILLEFIKNNYEGK